MSLEIHFNLQRDGFNMAVDLSLPRSGVTALFGPSGSGKTTLLRILAGLENFPGCKISFNDHIWQDNNVFIPAHERAVGYVFQEPSLFSHMKVQENLEYGRNRIPDTEQRISLDDAVSLLGIQDLLHRLPESLSGGEQQRVAIARTLAASPQLLLMDEPLSSLDNKLKLEILPYLESLHRELSIPVIYVSHATDEVARLADQLVIIKGGSILGSGPIQEMLTRLDLPLSHRNDAESLITATVSQIDSDYNLTHMEAGSSRFTVTGNSLQPGLSVRLRIAAHDVSLTLAQQTGTSIQNIFPVQVMEMMDENESQVLIKALLDDKPILVRITKKSAHDLDIAPGKQMFAQIKSIAVLA